MSKTPKKRKLENFDFSSKTRRQLAELKRNSGRTKKAIVEIAIDSVHTGKVGLL